MYDDEEGPLVSGHATDDGFAYTVKVRPPSREDIADALARAMIHDYKESSALRALVTDRVAALVREAVDDAAKAAIAAAMGAARQPTDEFGNPVGEPVTLAGMIATQVKAWQDETVDTYDGKPKKADPYSNGRTVTRREYLVRQVGSQEFEKLAKEEVQKVRTEAKARIDATIKGAVASAIQSLAAK